MRSTLARELTRNLGIAALVAAMVGTVAIHKTQAGTGQQGQGTTITFDHVDANNVPQALYDDDNKGGFTQGVNGTQAVIQKCSGWCNGDYIFDVDYLSGHYSNRYFFADLSQPAGSNAPLGQFHNLTNFHILLYQFGLLNVGDVVYEEAQMASDLSLNSSLNSYKIGFAVTAGDGTTPVQVTRVSATQWTIVANAATGDIAHVTLPGRHSTTDYGDFVVPFSATVTIP